MADRRDYFYRQLVTEAELDSGFDELEIADRRIVTDSGLTGVCAGATVVQHAGTPDLTVDVALGVAYNQLGERMVIPSPQIVNMALDSLNASTAVTTPGNEKWVSLFLKFKRVLSDPRVDGNSNTVYFVRDESFEFVKTQGAEAALGAAVKPALTADTILLADVQRLNPQTQILTLNHISLLRREDAYVISVSPFGTARVGTVKEAIATLAANLTSAMSGDFFETGVTAADGSDFSYSPARNVSRAVKAIGGANTPTDWTRSEIPGSFTQVTTLGAQCGFELDLPHGCSITAYSVRLDGAAHGGWPLGQLPRMRLMPYDQDDSPTTHDTTTDAPANQGAYEAAHRLSKTLGAPVVVDRVNRRYYIAVEGESGANAVAGLGVRFPGIEYSLSLIDEAQGG